MKRLRILLTQMIVVCIAVAGAIGIAAADQQIEARADQTRNAVQAAQDLSAEQKAQAVARIDEAIGFARDADKVAQAESSLRGTIDVAPTRLQLLKAQIARPASNQVADGYAGQSVEELDSTLAARRVDLARLQQALFEHEGRLNDLQAQSRSDAGELAVLEKRLSELSGEASSVDADDPLGEVDTLWRSARQALLDARADLISLRQRNIDLLIDLARHERQLSAINVENAKQDLNVLLGVLQGRRQQEAEAAISAADGVDATTLVGLQAIQADLARMLREQAGLIQQETVLERRLDQVNRTRDRLKRDYERMQQMVELGGSSTQVSSLLQKRRQLAPSPAGLAREALDLQQRLSDVGLRQLELDELLQELVDDQATLAYLQSTRVVDVAEIDAAGQNEALTQLGGSFRQTANDLWQDYTRFVAVLSQLEANTRSLAQEAKRYRGFIDDRLLWVPSAGLVFLDQPAHLVDGLRWFVEPTSLEALLTDLAALPTEHTAMTAFWLLGVVLLGLLRRRALAGLKRYEDVTRKVRTDRFSATIMAVFDTLVLVAWVPWILVGIGLLLGTSTSESGLTLVYAAGLQAAGQVILFLGFFRHLCRRHGLALVHLNWHPVLCEQLVRQALWLMPLLTPLSFFTAAGAAAVPSDFVYLAKTVQIDDPGVIAVGRLAFALQMLLLAIAAHRIWRRQGVVMTAFAASPDRNRWLSYHVLWFGPAVLLPILLGAFALFGYFYSATFLASVAGVTLWSVVATVLGRDLLLRGLLVAQRQLRFQEALRHREESQAQRASGDEAAQTSADNVLKGLEEERVNYSMLGDQVRSLVQLGFVFSIIAGLWWIWRDIFPAFTFLHNVELPITTSRLVDGVDKQVALTLSDMVAGLLLGGLALFAAMKVPAVLELTILQRLPMSRASRYAVTTLSQYVVAMIGIVITFKSLGLQWSSIQWLVAALSVGLGFGLQEIVANFISGIILLFEQPIRVGDVVTVDGTTGTVSKIRIRATTIVNWERQELVIPNKTFITGQLINWTLSDNVNRIFISVGVGYDTDTRRAMQLMGEVAEAHPNVVSDPPYRISFEGFGDNSLTLNMRAFLDNMESRLQTITELHQSILDSFRTAGIEIAFPQRDVHLSTTDPLQFQLSREPRSEGPPTT